MFVSEAGAAGKTNAEKFTVEQSAPLKTVDGEGYFSFAQAALVPRNGFTASRGLGRSVSGNTTDGQDYKVYAQGLASAVAEKETNGTSPAEVSGNTYEYGSIHYNRDAFVPKHVAIVPLITAPSVTTSEAHSCSPNAQTISTISEGKETIKATRCEWRGCEWSKDRDTLRGDSLMVSSRVLPYVPSFPRELS